MAFYAIGGFKATPWREDVIGLGESYSTAQAAEEVGRAQEAKWPDRIFYRVIEAADYAAAVAQCRKENWK